MCRITVFVPKTNMTQSTTGLIPFLNVIEANGANNKDGTGVTKLGKEVKTFKKAEEAVSLLVDGTLFNFLADYSGEKLLGHVRFATSGKGKKTDDNAHPFTFGSLTGVHNGHFSNYLEIKKQYNIPDQIEVDSAVFFYRLNMIVEEHKETNPLLTIEDIQKCVLEFTGNFAIVVYDSIGDKVWLVPHQNDLNIFDLGYAWLVNTSSGLQDILKYAENTLNFLFPSWGGNFNTKGEKIKNGFAFTIDGNGLVEVGKIELPKVVVAPNVHYHGQTYNNKTISTKEVYVNMQDKDKIITKYNLSFRAFYDLLMELPGIGSYDSLLPADLKIIDRFLEWLKKASFLDGIDEKCTLWHDIYLVKGDEYEYVRKHIPTFKKPFWLNHLDVIKSIPEPDETQRYED